MTAVSQSSPTASDSVNDFAVVSSVLNVQSDTITCAFMSRDVEFEELAETTISAESPFMTSPSIITAIQKSKVPESVPKS